MFRKKVMKTLLLFIFILFASKINYAQVHERWDVKTLTDGFQPTGPAKKITVAKIEPKPKIGVRNTQPRLNFEKQLITITGTISRIALEADGDYHIEVTDGSVGDSTLVCEAVDPTNSVTAQSPSINDFIAVRKVVQNLKKGNKVRFTGMLFQDKSHSPSPFRIRNFLEIHPIIKAEIME
jgi:hypothetical protein